MINSKAANVLTSSTGRRPPGDSLISALPTAIQLLRDPRPVIRRLAERHGRIFRTLIPDSGRFCDLVWLLGPEGSERILAAQYKEDFSWNGGYRFAMEPIFGADILFLLDDKPGCPLHRERHRALVPAFHPRTDADYLPIIDRLLDQRFAEWRRAGQIDLSLEVKRITFQVVAMLLLGAEEEQLDELMHTFEALGLGLFTMLRVPVPGLAFARALAARRRLADYLRQKIVVYRRDGLPANMLGHLMRYGGEEGEPISDESLVSEMVAFLFAGYDTTASLLTSFWTALADRSDVYGSLRDEARARPAQYEDLNDLPLLEAAILETERLHPPLIFAMRGVERDFEFGEFLVKADSKVAYSPWWSGRMNQLFDRADEFRPERFLDGKKPPPYSVLAFGGGHRSCIGKRFASLEMRLCVRRILERFVVDFLPNRSDEVFFNPTLQRKHGLWVRIID